MTYLTAGGLECAVLLDAHEGTKDAPGRLHHKFLNIMGINQKIVAVTSGFQLHTCNWHNRTYFHSYWNRERPQSEILQPLLTGVTLPLLISFILEVSTHKGQATNPAASKLIVRGSQRKTWKQIIPRVMPFTGKKWFCVIFTFHSFNRLL